MIIIKIQLRFCTDNQQDKHIILLVYMGYSLPKRYYLKQQASVRKAVFHNLVQSWLPAKHNLNRGCANILDIFFPQEKQKVLFLFKHKYSVPELSFLNRGRTAEAFQVFLNTVLLQATQAAESYCSIKHIQLEQSTFSDDPSLLPAS